ncbi:DUF5025 domain-containing protein [Pedobacter sp. MC2016-05]|uniref:DUF5025 domain-containing protein n=1 Tax=Pedobacter sp. MC2016-05 TaxID=2994474 RepID=UPI0022451D2A|nr:DUF5025 domain-containing protein [Pedobacter sp. MC2016-05]
MKSKFIIFFLAICLSMIACKKENTDVPKEDSYKQYFQANIAGKPINIAGNISTPRNIFHGSWTILGNSDGTNNEMYTVNVQVPKDVLNTKIGSKLQFQIFDIKTGEYLLNSKIAFQKDFSTHIYLVTELGTAGSKTYTTDESKKAFKISILKYQKPKDGSVPFVGGNLNGVLYNTKDLQDSIVIKDAAFEVRF